MKTHALPLAIILCLCPTIARAQVRLGIDIGLPAAPQLVVIAPGIQVVEGFQDVVDAWPSVSIGILASKGLEEAVRFEWIGPSGP
jgi:hypothetical protein